MIAALIALLIDLLLVKNQPSDIGQIPDGEIVTADTQENANHKTTTFNPYNTEEEWTVKDARNNSKCWMVLLVAIGLYIPYMMLISHGIAGLTDHGIDSNAAAFSMHLITVTSIVGRLLGGELCKRMSARYIWAGSLGVLLLGTLSLMFAKSIPMMAIYAVCTGIGFGSAFVCMPVVYSSYLGAKVYGSLFGTLFPIITLCSSASPAISGKLFDASGSYTSAFILVIAFNLWVSSPFS